MNLYIRLENGQPVDHPLVEENLLQAFPGIDVNNLPSNFVKFNRTNPTAPGTYDRLPVSTYHLVGNEVFEVWVTESMSPEEILEKQNLVKDNWANTSPYYSWVFDESTCEFVAPIPYPDDGNTYGWSESGQQWVLQPDA